MRRLIFIQLSSEIFRMVSTIYYGEILSVVHKGITRISQNFQKPSLEFGFSQRRISLHSPIGQVQVKSCMNSGPVFDPTVLIRVQGIGGEQNIWQGKPSRVGPSWTITWEGSSELEQLEGSSGWPKWIVSLAKDITVTKTVLNGWVTTTQKLAAV